MSWNNDLIDHSEPFICDSLSEALQYVESNYWCDPIIFVHDEDEYEFDCRYRAADFSQDGLVHYVKR